jgi:hypothetical protein
VLLVPAKDREGHRLMLVDYDGMYVPALARQPSGELGHPAYQHPQRQRDGVYSAEVDRFSHLAIYAAIHCLGVGKPDLWTRFDNGDNLLFREVDFQSPGNSDVLQELWALGDPEAHALIGRLILATQMPLDRAPLLREVLSNATIQPLSDDQERQVKALIGGGASKERAVARFTPEDLDSWLQPPPSEDRPVEPLSPAELASSWGNVAPRSPAIPTGQAPWGASSPGAPPAQQVSAYSKLCSELSPKAASGTRPTGPAAPPSLQQRIIETLRSHGSERKLYVSPDIPAQMASNAAKSCALRPDDTILGLIDCTSLGSASDALLFGKHGFYYHNMGANRPDPGFVAYREFPGISFRRAPLDCIKLGGDRYCSKAGSSISCDKMIEILDSVKRAVIECGDISRARQFGRISEDRPDLPAEAASGTRPTGPAAPSSLQARIVGILRLHRGENGLYVSPEIPTLAALHATKSCALPTDDTILGLIDCTLSGSGSAALVFGKHGFYYYNLGSMPNPGFVPYREFPGISLGTARPYCITLGGDRYCNKGGSRLSRHQIIQILKAVKSAVIEHGEWGKAESGFEY